MAKGLFSEFRMNIAYISWNQNFIVNNIKYINLYL